MTEQTEGEVGRNWAGNVAYAATELRRPVTVPEVQELVAQSPWVKPLGSRHSFNDIADTRGVLIDVSALREPIRIDEQRRRVEVPGGIRYGELAQYLEPQGWALANLASLPHISVAGAVATATHGSGDDNPTLSAAVVEVDLVTGTGELLTLRRGHDQDFAGAVVSVGALGVVTRLVLDIEPTFSMRQDLYLGLRWADLMEHFDEVFAAGYSVSVNPDLALGDRSRIRVKSRATEAPDELVGAARVLSERKVPQGATDRTGAPGPWLDRLPHFQLGFTPSFGDEMQTEYLLPREHGAAALQALRPLAAELRPLLHSIEVRTMCADDLWLSSAYERATVGIHFTWRLIDQELVSQLLPRIEDALGPFEPRPHWGKLFARCNTELPRTAEFRRLRDRLDPERRFANSFTARVLGE